MLRFAHLDHPLELGTVVCLHSAETFICENFHHIPCRVITDKSGVYLDLVSVGVQLISRVGRYAAVRGDLFLGYHFPADGGDEFCLSHGLNSFLFIVTLQVLTDIISIKKNKASEIDVAKSTKYLLFNRPK